MRVIALKRLREFWGSHADSQDALKTWYRIAERAAWKKLVDVQKTYPSAEFFEGWTVFNIKGNSYRLIVKMEYELNTIYINCVLTHAEYDKGGWK